MNKTEMSNTCPYDPPKMYIHLVYRYYFWAPMPYQGLSKSKYNRIFVHYASKILGAATMQK